MLRSDIHAPPSGVTPTQVTPQLPPTDPNAAKRPVPLLRETGLTLGVCLVDLKGRLSNPPQRRLSPTEIDDLIEAYPAGATIRQLAGDYGIHRSTVAGHLDRHGVPRHSEQTAWDDEILTQAAELYASGSSLGGVADQFGIDAQTVANRFRRAGAPVRARRGWT